MIRKCPFCKIVLNSGSGHIYKCKELDHPKSKEDIKFLYIEYNFPSISNKEILSREYFDNGKSLPDIKREYEIDYKSVLFLLKYYSLKSRTSSESSLLISVPKQRITMKEKYGIDWSSQLESVKEIKRANNNLKYGVDNIWKSQWFKDNLDKFYLEKYGIDRSQFNKNHWNSLSPIEQSNHMLKSALGSQNS